MITLPAPKFGENHPDTSIGQCHFESCTESLSKFADSVWTERLVPARVCENCRLSQAFLLELASPPEHSDKTELGAIN